jgi:hypothetical protein
MWASIFVHCNMGKCSLLLRFIWTRSHGPEGLVNQCSRTGGRILPWSIVMMIETDWDALLF